MASAGQIDAEDTVVCVLTGQGLKDPQSFPEPASLRGGGVEASLDAVLATLA
jgi:threonine synthase